MRTRHRISKLLLRRERYFPGPGDAWTRRHRDWLCSLRFDDRATQLCLSDYLHAHDVLVARRDRLGAGAVRAGARLAVRDDGAQPALPARHRHPLRGRALLRGARLPPLPSEAAGQLPRARAVGELDREEQRRGSITKAGSKHARRLLVEAAWHYRHRPYVSDKLARRQEGCDPRAVDIAWRAQRRLHRRWQRLAGERGKLETKVAVAVARELTCFCWEIATLG